MNGFVVRYRRAGWTIWVFWPCKSLDEAKNVKRWLLTDGYEVAED